MSLYHWLKLPVEAFQIIRTRPIRSLSPISKRRSTGVLLIFCRMRSVRLPNATFEYHLGLAYQQDGNAAEAEKHLTRALSVY